MAINLPNQTITIDINRKFETNIRCIANVNDKGTRFVDVKLTADGTVLDLSGCTATATFVTDEVLISDSVACKIRENNIICVPLEKFNSRSGIMSIELKITSPNSENVLNTPIAFKAKVTPSIKDGAHITEISYGTTEEILKEVAIARGNYSNLNERLGKIQTDITGKADKATTLAGYGITDGEKSSNKVSAIDFQTASETQYPNVAGLKDYHVTYVATLYDDVDNLSIDKADKATTLAGYGITDAYTKDQTSKYLNFKQDKLGWDTVPTQNSPNSMTSGSIFAALQSKANTADVNSKLALKYDAANVETGSGTLECADETLADKLAVTFKYQKIGKFCLLDIQIKATEKIDSDVMFDGLPFVAKSASYNACSSNYGNVRSLLIPYGNSKLKLIGGITTTTTVAITVIYRIEN